MLLDDEWRDMVTRIDAYVERRLSTHSDLEVDQPMNPAWLKLRRLVEEYNELTGELETNPNAVLHHVRTLYGSPCQFCGEVLRTSRASYCFLCHRTQEPHPPPEGGGPA